MIDMACEAEVGRVDDAPADWGDFVCSDDEVDIEEVAELPEEYEQGLFYPICIGEVLAGNYRIKHKLGHSGFSTVWMAHDISDNRDVALKILRPGGAAGHTFLLRRADHDHYRVLVLPLQGPNLRDYSRDMSVVARWSAAKQLLQALRSLHDGGVVHGDLTSANVMCSLQLLETCSTTTEKYKYLGRPQKMPIPADPLWEEGQLVMSMSPRKSLIKQIHNASLSYSSDMWNYMCLMVKALGPVPAPWRDSYKGGGQCNESWYDQSRAPDPNWALEARVAQAGDDNCPMEQQLVLSILRKGLPYLPEDRLAAAQLLEDASFRAIMDMYGL
ncbi:kinase domain-containing protein [Dactylonectria macrodidyma]|uniref:non-specific serine/threonine protein kinase n=1 Tax=Dactylonectria macrodidyma TaxID=307937 RepID=A0A9P9IS64_9HYPO|nr:kinase domain-containing protein [Dactylonectria macrodidyma]